MVTKNVKAKNHTPSAFANSKRKSRESQNPHNIIEDVMGFAETLLHSRKVDGADKLHEIAEATRNYAASMPNMPMISEQVDVASGSIDDLANYIADNDMEQMIEDAGTFARRRPIATLLVTMAAGVAVTRFLLPTRQNSATRNKMGAGLQKKGSAKRRGTNGAAEAHP